MDKPEFTVVVAERYNPAAIERLRSIATVEVLDSCDDHTLKKAVAGCDALLVRSYAQVTRDVIEHAPRLRVIGRGGVGLDNIDVEAARESGIQVVYRPAAATDAVADLTMGLIISLARKISHCDRMIRADRFAEARSMAPSRELAGLTLGIVGLGRIGRAVARRCSLGFGMAVLFNDIVAPGRLDFTATRVEKPELFARSDVVSLHIPLTDQTRYLIDGEALSGFKPDAILVNTARGAVIDGYALASALGSGALAGAALDVFEPEPLRLGHPLLEAPNTLFTPHIGARTKGGLARMNDVVDDVIAVLADEKPEFPAWV